MGQRQAPRTNQFVCILRFFRWEEGAPRVNQFVWILSFFLGAEVSTKSESSYLVLSFFRGTGGGESVWLGISFLLQRWAPKANPFARVLSFFWAPEVNNKSQSVFQTSCADETWTENKAVKEVCTKTIAI
jgi:hypothetical protein